MPEEKLKIKKISQEEFGRLRDNYGSITGGWNLVGYYGHQKVFIFDNGGGKLTALPRKLIFQIHEAQAKVEPISLEVAEPKYKIGELVLVHGGEDNTIQAIISATKFDEGSLAWTYVVSPDTKKPGTIYGIPESKIIKKL